MESKYLYLGILIISIFLPLLYSFDKRFSFYKKWKGLFIGILIMMSIFITWDIVFTKHQIWWFHKDYITGFKISSLPIEEWMFFIIIPYCCLFIYEALKYFFKKDHLAQYSKPIFYSLGFILLISSIFIIGKTYTFTILILSGIACMLQAYYNPKWSGRFLSMFLVSLIPFFWFNGTLTGMFTANPVVNYDSNEIINLRLFTIPIEDVVYNLLMLLVVTAVFEKINSKDRNSELA